jgi:membrane associated rhomboid family serine protease
LIAENPLSVGASGAIWGLMAAGFGMVLRPGGPLPRLVAQRLRQRLLGVLAINGALSFLPGIDLWAHLGGGLAGFALAMGGLCGRRHEQTREPRVVAFGAYVSVAVLVLALALAFAVGQPWQTGRP